MNTKHFFTRIICIGLFLTGLNAWSIAQTDTVPAEDEVAGELEAPKIDGKPLFKSLCASCHHPTQRLVGPALQGIKERRDSTWLVNFVASSQSMIEAGDSTAIALFNEFNQVPMPDHPQLSQEQIMAIIDYASSPPELAEGPDQPISRPDIDRIYYEPLSFSSFSFWLIYTATVFMIMGWLYYMIEYTEIIKKATGDKEGDEGVPFGEQ